MRLYKSKPSYDEDQVKHAKYFDLTGSMKCPECKELIENIKLTDHFEEKHTGKTCCIGNFRSTQLKGVSDLENEYGLFCASRKKL